MSNNALHVMLLISSVLMLILAIGVSLLIHVNFQVQNELDKVESQLIHTQMKCGIPVNY